MSKDSSSPSLLGVITEADVAMPMRDGVSLQGHVFRPDAPGRYPVLLVRTPYGRPKQGMERFVRAGYVVVSQDIRGRWGSDGDFVLFSEPRTQDGEDGYDSIEWVARQPWCNGAVGTFGVSYGAWVQWKAAELRPPHLRAMSAQSIPVELTEVDYTGSFRPARRLHWWLNTIGPDLRRRAGMPKPHDPGEAGVIWHDIEFGRTLHMLPIADVARRLPPQIASHVADWLQNPAQRVWRFDETHRDVAVPNLDISGWYDHCNGSMGHLGIVQQTAATDVARRQSKLIIGPWNHVGLGARQLGQTDFGPQAQVDTVDVLIRWFDHWLKGVDNGVDRDPPVRYFVMGSGVWKQADTWPAPMPGTMTLYLAGDTLQNSTPAEARVQQYLYDPQDPVPTLWGPRFFTEVSDRRRLDYRQDILRYRTAPLDRDVEVVGLPTVELHAASTAPDTDFFARLIDEHPDGRRLDVCYGMVRARHRHGLERCDLITPGEVTPFTITLGATACRFLAGHRIHLEITSSDYPNHDRNHNTGGNDIAETTLVLATQSIHSGGAHASRLVLPVAEPAQR